ncbi:cation diffusion facilitator family transporter [Endozoicomonas sp. G2_1]|uniref:cation diffusion facilitator family transporter n=1 Tax=Endozoicomonas sp. G2_1 TaxID=2821091 RepID=UPI001ADB6090|nr:cation diffusion facilitator family transporter [Endozoicomonas sp. G2_1]MBO9491847.1 cation diffusion facilitator family transporter [Endozoicomonas sp. G2_1]
MTNQYQFWVNLAAKFAIFSAVLLLLIKLYAWWSTDASVMLASATDSLVDLFASAANVLMLKVALSPPDENHNYGHGKAESLAGLLQAAFVAGSAVLLLVNGIEHIAAPKSIQQASIAIWVTVLSLAMTILLVMVQHITISKTESVAIKADSLHYKGDILLNLSVLAALLLAEYVTPTADGIFTCLVASYLLINSVVIAKQSIDQLMDRTLAETELEQVKHAIRQHPEVIGYRNLKARKSGAVSFIQVDLELADHLTLLTAHDIGLQVEEHIHQVIDNAEVVIHHEPAPANRSLY